MDQHLKEPRVPTRGGKLVLSHLAAGSSVLGAKAPSLKMVLAGEELYQVDGRTIRIRPGQYLYLDAGADCLGTNRTETTGLCLMLPITNDNARQDWVPDAVLGRAIALSARNSAMGRKLLEYGRQIARDPSLGPALAPAIVNSVGEALEEPLTESKAAMERLNAAKASTRRELFQRLDCARAHLHDHPDRAVSLAELAGVARLSQFHLARYFKLAFGQAPIAYHRAIRLERAARFLATGCGSVAEAAEAAGYSDQTALSHAFSRHYGKPPQQWAMNARG
jgi:AraC-like DNA-binding protein/quercetin dioxygenase-like cupin family protein